MLLMIRGESNVNRTKPEIPAALGAAEFGEQFRRSFRILWRVAAGVVGEASLAEDVVQDAAMVALGKLGQFTPGTNFTAWMARMVRYVALNRARKEHKHRTGGTERELLDRAPDRSSGERRGDATRSGGANAADGDGGFNARVAAALDDVNETARACLLLRTLDGLNYSEISELLGIPEGTAMSHVHRTRRLLRVRLAGLEPGGPKEDQTN